MKPKTFQSSRQRPLPDVCAVLAPVFTALSLALALNGALAQGQAAEQSLNQAKPQPPAAPRAVPASPARSALPQRDLLIELRQASDTQAGGYSVSTQPQAAPVVAQQLRVRNGEAVSWNVGQSMPMQWTQSVVAQNSKLDVSGGLGAPGLSASSQGGGVAQGLTWIEAGQSISARPRWPGGNQPVTVEVAVQSASVQERTGPELPTRTSSQLATVVSVPLNQWVTIATTGAAPQKGVYSTRSSSDPQRLLQIRVQLSDKP